MSTEEISTKNKMDVVDKILEKLGVDVKKLSEKSLDDSAKEIVGICDKGLEIVHSAEIAAEFSPDEIAQGEAFFLENKNHILSSQKRNKDTNRFITKMYIYMSIIHVLDDPFFKAGLVGTWLIFFARLLW